MSFYPQLPQTASRVRGRRLTLCKRAGRDCSQPAADGNVCFGISIRSSAHGLVRRGILPKFGYFKNLNVSGGTSMKKTLTVLALAGSIALIGSAPAVADDYRPLPSQAAVSDGTVGPGETFVFRGQGFLAGESLTIRVTPGQAPASNGANIAGSRAVAARISVVTEAQTLKAQADAQGAFSLPIAINEPGTYSITATGDTSGVTVGPVTVTVVPAALVANGNAVANASDKSVLAETGADSGLVLWTLVGAGALAAGATSVVVVRRRAKAEVAA